MNNRGSRSLHWWVSIALAVLGLVTVVALTVQGFSSQTLVEHRIWRDVLHSFSNAYLERRTENPATPPPVEGVFKSWLVIPGSVPDDLPSYLRQLAPGYYSTEGLDSIEGTPNSFHALVTAVEGGQFIAVIDIGELEAQQNRYALWNGAWGALAVLLIAGLIIWLHLNLVRPVRDLARRIGAIDPSVRGERLPLDYRQEELRVIAQASNEHLERVEKFTARERSLLEQASHEFRTPVAVISGAMDVLNQAGLPDNARPAMRRIKSALESLSETMVALLYVSREPLRREQAEGIALHDLIPALVLDHEHLYIDKALQVRLGTLQPTLVEAPEPMLRIAVGNLLRNAIENTAAGHIEISLEGGVVCITDSGVGFDAAEAARRYRDSVRDAMPVWGQGLGMFIVARICDRFKWQLRIDSEPGSGTRVMLDLAPSVVGRQR